MAAPLAGLCETGTTLRVGQRRCLRSRCYCRVRESAAFAATTPLAMLAVSR